VRKCAKVDNEECPRIGRYLSGEHARITGIFYDMKPEPAEMWIEVNHPLVGPGWVWIGTFDEGRCRAGQRQVVEFGRGEPRNTAEMCE